MDNTILVEAPLSACELAKRLGVNRQRIYAFIHAGLLSAFQTSNGYMISAAECDRLIAAREEIIGQGGRKVVFRGFRYRRRLIRAGGEAQRTPSYRRGALAYPSSPRHGSGPDIDTSEIV